MIHKRQPYFDCLTVTAYSGSIPVLTDFAEQNLAIKNCPAELVTDFKSAVYEIADNICRYAYPGNKYGTITEVCMLYDREYNIILIDCGIPFDPLKFPDTFIETGAVTRQDGGLGIYIVKELMDKVEYIRRYDMNVLILSKKEN